VTHGANVVFADRDEDGLETQIGEAAQQDDSRVRTFAGDLREKLTIVNLLSATIDAFDRVDILVNASRQMVASDPLNADDDAVEMLIDQNLMTSLRLTQHIAKRMIKQAEEDHETAQEPDEDGGTETPNAPKPASGTIINLSSIAARRTHPELLGYSVSCAALDQMTRSMAVALAPHHIRVNGIAFGSVMSASLEDTLRDDEVSRRDILDHTPLSRIASPGEVAEAAQFLASEGSGFMTGQIMTIDGGRTLLDSVTAAAH
jgi:7-alpha-hydroxysteroid dehydrogenase